MDQNLTGKTLIIETFNAEGAKKTSIRLPLVLVTFIFKVLNLLPARLQAALSKELSANGVACSFETLLREGQEALLETFQDIEINVNDDKQTLKLSIV